ncbi:hypothetical protein SLEP1_g3043 [Rubroshorea leprosula]|uniref:Uncharacterized protein n=1 Tax=Rubroshorea leprosula TaxID=152421 RepID=A0AAV5HUY7_9ROSI|nr:hypothetical protein SLEP1_g3043 [Rubroshorea leprosula]
MPEIALLLSPTLPLLFLQKSQRAQAGNFWDFYHFCAAVPEMKDMRFSVVLSRGSGCLGVISEDDAIGKMAGEAGDQMRRKSGILKSGDGWRKEEFFCVVASLFRIPSCVRLGLIFFFF